MNLCSNIKGPFDKIVLEKLFQTHPACIFNPCASMLPLSALSEISCQ